ncbi:MAG: ABC transporter ATP-binding protein [Actinobacteria bacterium]|nr:ABC transporter ATP-binding protein [Actinomycetota bacterium]
MVSVTNLEKPYAGERGAEVRAVDGVSFEVAEGRFFTLLGPSGCGKTTTLRCIAGLEKPAAGEIALDRETVYSASGKVFVSPDRRPIGMVFQSYAIWPHMTVFENVAYPLRAGPSRAPRPEIGQRVEQVLARVQLDGLEGRSATKLSGGQQQRLALARAIVREPKVLLLDEPLSNLDAKLREQMRLELKALQRHLGITSIYVTHDQVEALGLSNRIAVMKAGKIQQIGRPRDIYERPATQFVAEFVGSINWIEGTVMAPAGSDGFVSVRTSHGELRCVSEQVRNTGDQVLVSIRPEYVEVLANPGDDANIVKGKVEITFFLGDYLDCQLDLGGQVIRARLHPSAQARRGSQVYVRLPESRCVVLAS